MSERRVVLLATGDTEAVQMARVAVHEESKKPPIVEPEWNKKSYHNSTLALTAAALGVGIPIRRRSPLNKMCSRCQKPFDGHPGAYCSKECFQASNRK